MSKEGQLHLCQGDKDRSSTDHIKFKLKIIDFCLFKIYYICNCVT